MVSSDAIDPHGKKGRIHPSLLGDRLRQLRHDEGLTMREVAIAIDSSDNRISDWENGVSEPKLTTLVRYGVLFDLSVSQMLNGVM